MFGYKPHTAGSLEKKGVENVKNIFKHLLPAFSFLFASPTVFYTGHLPQATTR